MSATLLSMPLEVHQLISASVHAVHPRSLFEFSLASKACYAACTHLLYQHIKITVHGPGMLQPDAEELLRSLRRTNSTRHVRRIVLEEISSMDTSWIYSKPWWKRYGGLEEIVEDEEEIYWGGRHVVYDGPVIEKKSNEDTAWTPVVRLLGAIHHLTDLVYDCQTQFPPCLLQELQERHPQCRLHHFKFRFRTLAWGGNTYPYEMELATSPLLYAVKVACGKRDSEGEDDFNLEAVMELASLAPSLRQITILALRPMLSHRYRRARDLWRGLPGYTDKSMGRLTTLSIIGESDLKSPTILQDWASHTDFSQLQHLVLGGCMESNSSGLTSETMEWISRTQSFPQLKTLRVYLDRDDMWIERPDFTSNAISFFQSLPPLEKLSVAGPMDSSMFDAIVSRHGQTVQKLSLNPFEEHYYCYVGARIHREIPLQFPFHRLQQIQAECPVLRELTIPVRRSKSSAAETKLYRCFAAMENLRILNLTLDCSNWHVRHDSTYIAPNEYPDDAIIIDPPMTRGILREFYINCAVDETLARSIWALTSGTAQGNRSQLQRLKLCTAGGNKIGGGGANSHLTDPMDYMSQSWLIEDGPQGDGQDIVVRALGQREREARHANSGPRVQPTARIVFESIWPRGEGSESWKDDWASFPLQT